MTKTTETTQGKIVVGKTSSQINEPWYKRPGNATDINHFLKQPPSKAVSYFKVLRRARGGSQIIEQYWKTLDNGYMVYVDLAQMKMGVVMGFPQNFSCVACTKKDYKNAWNKLNKALSV